MAHQNTNVHCETLKEIEWAMHIKMHMSHKINAFTFGKSYALPYANKM